VILVKAHRSTPNFSKQTGPVNLAELVPAGAGGVLMMIRLPQSAMWIWFSPS
jgi:hypothetical protein